MPDLRSVGAKLAVALVVGSVIQALTKTDYLVLVPGEVLSLPIPRVWQLLTYGFIALDPLSVIFGAIVMVSIGGALEAFWGARRLLTFALGVTVLSGVITCVIFMPIQSQREAYFPGAWVMGSAMWVAFGLHMGRGQTNFWGMPVTGNQLAAIGAGFVVLNALMSSVLQMVPQLVAITLTFAYMRGANPRLWWLKMQSWRLGRQVKARSRHLKVISPQRNTPRDSDRYLH
jgi:membrane associated rhomboid family serine protease